MTTIDITQLTPEQKRQIAAQVKAEESAKKEQRQRDLETLENLAKETVPEAVKVLIQASNAVKDAKAAVFELFRDYLKLKLEVFKTKSGQKTHTITADGMSITLGYRVTDGYTDDANYGIAMIHEYIATLAKDDNSKKLTSAIFRLLQKNAKGDLDSKKVLELAQMANNEWSGTPVQEGVEIIQKAFQPKMSKWFIEASQTDGKGVEVNIPLSITTANLPADFDLSFLLPKEVS